MIRYDFKEEKPPCLELRLEADLRRLFIRVRRENTIDGKGRFDKK
jgi:hypothetical protein